MSRRFRNLEVALRYLNAPNTDGADPAEAPANSQLKFYQDWKAGKRNVEYGDRAAGSKPGNLKNVAIKPFGFAGIDTTEYIVDLSGRAETNFTATGLNLTTLSASEDLSNARATVNFRPAKVTVTVTSGTTSTTETSKLTGRKYKDKNRSSYTYPFGRTAGDPDLASRKSAILTAVNAGEANRTASFQPEVFN